MPTVRQVADYFLARAREAGEPLTLRELQTLCFYAQGFHLGVWAEPLFSDDVLETAAGPVVPGLEEECGEQSASGSSSDCAPPDSERRAVRKILDGTFDARRSFASAEQRRRAANSCRRGEAIPHDEIEAAFLAWARERQGAPEPPIAEDEVRRILAGSEALERVRRGEADLAAGRIQPLK